MPATKPPVQEVEFEVVGKERSGTTQGRPDADPLAALIARLMDDAFVIPGTKVRFGLDPLIGLIPGLGATASSLVSLAVIYLGARRGVPMVVLARMAVNVLANAAIDSVPVLGDIGSIFFRSNARNYELLQKHMGSARPSTTGDWIFLALLFAVILVVIGLTIAWSYMMYRLMLAPLEIFLR